VALELRRQQMQVEMLASENLVSAAVLEVQGTVLASRGSESHFMPRDYPGCEHLDRVVSLAEDRVKALFDANYANVLPHSGSHASHAAMLAHVQPGQTVLRMLPDSGGSRQDVTMLPGKWYDTVYYGRAADSGLLDYHAIHQLALQHRPTVLVAGGSAYPRQLDLPRFREIADEAGAMLVVDMTHIAGLAAAGLHPNPLPAADLAILPTHRTLRGPRGGVILSNRAELAAKTDAACFPAGKAAADARDCGQGRGIWRGTAARFLPLHPADAAQCPGAGAGVAGGRCLLSDGTTITAAAVADWQGSSAGRRALAGACRYFLQLVRHGCQRRRWRRPASACPRRPVPAGALAQPSLNCWAS
jgi:hypothetical protein